MHQVFARSLQLLGFAKTLDQIPDRNTAQSYPSCVHDSYFMHDIQPLLHIHDAGMWCHCQISLLLFIQALEVRGGLRDPFVMFTGVCLQGNGVRQVPSLINYCLSELCGKRADLPAHWNTREMSFHLAEASVAICCCSSGQGFPGARLPRCTEVGTAFPSKDHAQDGGWGGELQVGCRLLLESLFGGARGRGRMQVALSSFLKIFSGVSTSVPWLSVEAVPSVSSLKIRRKVEHRVLFWRWHVLLPDTLACWKGLQPVNQTYFLKDIQWVTTSGCFWGPMDITYA